jgi:hypothetical protein
MAERRTAEFSLLLLTGRKTKLKIDVFDAAQWKQGAKGLYRARLNGRWYAAPKQRFSFKTIAGIGEYFAGHVARMVEGEDAKPKRPNIPVGTSVRVFNGAVVDGQRQYDVTRTATDPIQCVDGRWYVAVVMLGRGMEMRPVDEMEVRK